MASTSANCTSRNGADPVCRPRMGVRDIGRQTPLSACKRPPSYVCGSERSLPEKLTSAIRNFGRKAAAMNRMTSSTTLNDASESGTTVDEDLVFYSSSNPHNIAMRPDRRAAPEVTPVKATRFRKNQLGYSKSAEKLCSLAVGPLSVYPDPLPLEATVAKATTDAQRSKFYRFQSDMRLCRADADHHYENVDPGMSAKADFGRTPYHRNICCKDETFHGINPCCSSLRDLFLKHTAQGTSNKLRMKEDDETARMAANTSPTDSGYRSVPRSMAAATDDPVGATSSSSQHREPMGPGPSQNYANFHSGSMSNALDELRNGQQRSRPNISFGDKTGMTVSSNEVNQTLRSALVGDGESLSTRPIVPSFVFHECSSATGGSTVTIDGKTLSASSSSAPAMAPITDVLFLEGGVEDGGSSVSTATGVTFQESAAASSIDTLSTNGGSGSVIDDYAALVRCPKLIELGTSAPWSEKTIVALTSTGRLRASAAANRVTVSAVPKIHCYVKRLFLRIARELQRFCRRFGKCSKHDVHYATKVILPTGLAEACLKAAVQAVTLYAMRGIGDSVKQSRSTNAGLTFSVGKFFRWLCDAQIAPCIDEAAVIYLTAVVQNLAEEMILMALPSDSTEVLSAAVLDAAMANSAEFWGLLQPYAHIVCSRIATGALTLPESFTTPSRHFSLHVMSRGSSTGAIDQCLLATCVGSVKELVNLIDKVSVQQKRMTDLQAGRRSSTSMAKATARWSRCALEALFYFMRCSQLERANKPYAAAPTIPLTHERPYLMLPPLIDWYRIIEANCDHRMGTTIESSDVLQAARVLLPYLDYPPAILGDEQVILYDETSESVETLKEHVSFLVVTSAQPEKISCLMEQLRIRSPDVRSVRGLTPLMLACLQGDLERVKALIGVGASVNAVVSGKVQNGSQTTTHSDVIAGWTALNFAVIRSNLEEVKYLLERGASLELSTMVTETPLQIAAMTGNYEAARLLLSFGADPYYSTLKAPNGNGFRRQGSPAPVVLAASHGQRKVLHLLTTCRRYSASEEPISLADFLAEACSTTNRRPSREDKAKAAVVGTKFVTEGAPTSAPQLGKRERKVLTEAMYVAAENQYLDLVLDISSMGISWNAYIWTMTLSAAVETGRKALVQMLFDDYLKHPLEVTDAFIDTGLSLMFDVLLHYQDEMLRVQAMEIFASLYKANPIQPLLVPEATVPTPRIDAKYVNSPELSDVQFVVDDQTFYAHKIVLANASDGFKHLLAVSNVSGQCLVAIKDVTYDVFMIVMRFLYTGELAADEMDLPTLADVLRVATTYDLSSLKKRCEQVLSQNVTLETCLFIYDIAQKNQADELMRFCEGFMLGNGPCFMQCSDNFHVLLLSGSCDLVKRLSKVLTEQLHNLASAKP